MLAAPDDGSTARTERVRRCARSRVRLRLCLVVCSALLAARTPAFAHARLERSSPAAGAALGSSPATVELKFNELLDDEFNDVKVFRARSDGAPADDHSATTGKPRVDPADRTRLTTDLDPLAPGAYVVQWKVLSRDGHSARGRVLFSVGAAN